MGGTVNVAARCLPPISITCSKRNHQPTQVVWLVIALALYRPQSISEVVDDLDLALSRDGMPFVSKSAVTQARQRTGQEPLAWLFEKSAQA